MGIFNELPNNQNYQNNQNQQNNSLPTEWISFRIRLQCRV